MIGPLLMITAFAKYTLIIFISNLLGCFLQILSCSIQRINDNDFWLYLLIILLPVFAISIFLSHYYTRKKITDKHRAIFLSFEAQKAELLQCNATKDKLLSIIAHDIKSSLNSLQVMLSGIDYNTKSTLHNNGDFTLIKEDIRATQNLLNNILIWSSYQKNEIKISTIAFDLVALINDSVNLISSPLKRKKINLISCVPSIKLIEGDQDIVYFVIRNLLCNAVKYTQPGGEIKICIQQKEQFVVVSIKDNGVGMDESEQQKLKQRKMFRLDQGSSQQGTGLGLYLCEEFLTKMDGKLKIESKVGEGSTFSAFIPFPAIY